MNKKFHPVLAIVLIIIFALFIILPPVCREFFPKVEKTVGKEENETISTIICTRSFQTEQMEEKIETRYINNKIDQTRITYQPITRQIEEPAMTIENDILPSQELAYFQGIQGTEITTVDTRTLITINQNTIDQNPDNIDLKNNYFNDDKITQKINYTNRNFECTEENLNN